MSASVKRVLSSVELSNRKSKPDRSCNPIQRQCACNYTDIPGECNALSIKKLTALVLTFLESLRYCTSNTNKLLTSHVPTNVGIALTRRIG
jgi:hypothetical protein